MAQVPNADVDFDGDGVTAIFDFDFPYQKQSEIFVSVDGVNATYTWLAGNTHSVQVLPAPALGTKVRIYRSTLAFKPLHVFAAGVPFLPRYVDENNRQLIYVVQEGIDTSNSAVEIANGIAATAAEALATANNAKNVADNALGVAQGIAATAEAALVASGQATNTANNALTIANGIDAKATQAMSESGRALTAANQALSTANAVDGKATQARADSGAALTAANQALTTANAVDAKAQQALDRANYASGAVDNLYQQVQTNAARIANLDNSIEFILIYPNGNAGAPGTFPVNTRLLVNNPWGASVVIPIVEVLFNGVWAEPGFVFVNGGGGYGTKATQVHGTSQIAIQSGSVQLVIESNQGGGGHASTANSTGPLPVRLKLWRVKG